MPAKRLTGIARGRKCHKGHDEWRPRQDGKWRCLLCARTHDRDRKRSERGRNVSWGNTKNGSYGSGKLLWDTFTREELMRLRSEAA